MVDLSIYRQQTSTPKLQQHSPELRDIAGSARQELANVIGGTIDRQLGISDEQIERARQTREDQRNLKLKKQSIDMDIALKEKLENAKADYGLTGEGYIDGARNIIEKYESEAYKGLPERDVNDLKQARVNNYASLMNQALKYETTQGAAAAKQNANDIADYYINNVTEDKSTLEATNKHIADTINSLQNINPVLRQDLIQEKQDAATQRYHELKANNAPQEYIQDYEVKKVTPEKVINDIIKVEGGYVKDDAGKGETNFGINISANPDIDVKNLTKSQASKIYKARYWDAINADSLAPDMQYIAMDAAVNQGVSWTKSALDQAKGDVDAFYQLRKERYETTAKSPKKKKYLKSWLNRLDESYQKSQAAANQQPKDEYAQKYLPVALKKREQTVAAQKKQTTEHLYKMANDGKVTPEDADALLQKGIIDSKQHKTIRSEANKYFKALEESTKYYKILNAGNADNPEYEDAVNWSYDENVLPLMQGKQPLEKSKIAVETVVNAQGVIPKTLNKQLNNAFNISNPEQGIFLAETVNTLRKLPDRTAIANLSDDLINYADVYQNALVNDMAPSEAARIAHDYTHPDNATVEFRTTQFTEQLKDDDIKEFGLIEKYGDAGFFESVFGDVPDYDDIAKEQMLYPQMSDEFAKITKHNYIRNGGDIEAATNTAKEKMNRLWGVSIGGKLMKYPPEKMYGFDDRSLIESDLYGGLSEKFNIPFDDVEEGGYGLILSTQQQKAVERGDKPSYMVTKDGAPVYQRDEQGRKSPYIYTPDIDKLQDIQTIKQQLKELRDIEEQKELLKKMAGYHNVSEKEMAKKLLKGKKDKEMIRKAITSIPDLIYDIWEGD